MGPCEAFVCASRHELQETDASVKKFVSEVSEDDVLCFCRTPRGHSRSLMRRAWSRRAYNEELGRSVGTASNVLYHSRIWQIDIDRHMFFASLPSVSFP